MARRHCSPQSISAHVAPPAPERPVLQIRPSQFMLIERQAEDEFRPLILKAIQEKVNAVADSVHAQAPDCPTCERRMGYHDAPQVSWLSRFGSVWARACRYRCKRCKQECRPLLDLLGVEPGRVSGSLARLLALLAAVCPYDLAARLALLFFGVEISAMGVWRVVQRLGKAAARYSDQLSAYHADSRSEGAAVTQAPDVILLGLDGCNLGMQVRQHRRHRKTSDEQLSPLPPVEDGHFQEVKTGALLLPSERVQPSPGRRSVLRRFLVTCLGDADEIYNHVWAKLRELGWLGGKTVVVIVGDGAEWIWNRASMFPLRCEILDFWHALEHAWEFGRLQYGEGSKQADRWVHRIAEDLRAGKVKHVIARLKHLTPSKPELRKKLDDLIRYYTDNADRMRYDEYLRLGYGIGSGAVESAHKQVVHARLRQAGMRWSEAGARRLLALRLLLLNDEWALLDRLRMESLAA